MGFKIYYIINMMFFFRNDHSKRSASFVDPLVMYVACLYLSVLCNVVITCLGRVGIFKCRPPDKSA